MARARAYFNPDALYRIAHEGLNLSCHLCGSIGVKNVVESIIGTDKGVTLYLENAGYEGEIGKNGHCKVYRYTIAGCDKDIDMQIIASFCGTVADPMSAYDLTVLMN